MKYLSSPTSKEIKVLEPKIDELKVALSEATEVIKALTAAIGAMQVPGPVDREAEHTMKAMNTGARPHYTKEEIPNDPPKSSDTTSGEPSALTGESSSPVVLKEGSDEELKAAHANGVITYKYAVKPITIRLSGEKGREITLGVLSRFGVKSAQDLDAAQWADYIAHCGKVLAGGEV
jgi:hypothetical protein